MKRRIAILTKSARHGYFCIVGYDIEKKILVRLISNDESSEGSILNKHLICADGKNTSILDIVDIDILSKKPSETHPEDILINEKFKWEYVDKFDLKNLPSNIYCTDYFIFGDPFSEITLNDAKQIKKSIVIAKVKNLYIHKNENNKAKANFIYNDCRYTNFSVTDPDFFDVNKAKYESAILVISLPNDKWSYNNNRFFKFIAKVFITDTQSNL